MKYFPATARTIIERVPPSAAERGEESPMSDFLSAPLALPVAGIVSPDAVPPWNARAAGGPPRILLVDDNAGVVDLVTQVLGAAGYQICSTGDGESAWEHWNRFHVDLLIADHEMPRLTGLELLRRVRAAGSAVPAILLSGNLPRHEPDLPLLLRPGALVAKPFLLSHLATLVGSLLAHGVQDRAREAAECVRDAERHAALHAHGA